MDKAQTDAWIAIQGEKNLQARFDKLEEYYKTYGDKDERNAIYMYSFLAEAAYQLQQFDKTIQYGEKALLYKETDAQNKLRVYLFLANAYNQTKKDIDKAYSYADSVIELAKSLRLETQGNTTFDSSFIAPALRIQVQLLLSKPPDIKNTTDAYNKALESYNLDRSEKSANFVLFLSERMVKIDKVEEAIKGVETINQAKPNADYYKMLGVWYG
jgi:tetratricopeptide (TPR) repeat protein